MIDADASVHDNNKSVFLSQPRSPFINYSLLHPDHLGLDRYRLTDNRLHLLRPPEDVDNIYLVGNGRQIRIALLSQNFFMARIYRDDAVPGLLHIPGDPVAGTGWLGGKTDNRNDPVFREYRSYFFNRDEVHKGLAIRTKIIYHAYPLW